MKRIRFSLLVLAAALLIACCAHADACLESPAGTAAAPQPLSGLLPDNAGAGTSADSVPVWREGTRVEIYRSNIVIVSLVRSINKRYEACYYLEAENRSGNELRIEVDRIRFNDVCFGEDGSLQLTVPPGLCSSAILDQGSDSGLVGRIGQIECELRGYYWLYEDGSGYGGDDLFSEHVRLKVEGDASVEQFAPAEGGGTTYPTAASITSPTCGYSAGEQTIYEDDRVAVRLICLGASEDYRDEYLMGYIAVENRTPDDLYFEVEAQVLNGELIPSNGFGSSDPILPGSVCYQRISVGAPPRFATLLMDTMTEHGIDSLASVDILFRVSDEPITDFSSRVPLLCASVEPDQHGEAEGFREGEQVVFAENGLRVAFARYACDEEGNEQSWTFTVVNDSDKDVKMTIHSQDDSKYLDFFEIPAHYRTKVTGRLNLRYSDKREVEVPIRIEAIFFGPDARYGFYRDDAGMTQLGWTGAETFTGETCMIPAE